jgi:hypothetical protein
MLKRFGVQMDDLYLNDLVVFLLEENRWLWSHSDHFIKEEEQDMRE